MTEEELRKQLEGVFESIYKKQLELTQAIIDAHNKAFEIGIEVGKQLPKE